MVGEVILVSNVVLVIVNVLVIFELKEIKKWLKKI